MLAILGGLGAAVCWAMSAMSASRSSRVIGSWATLAWVMLLGTVVALPATGVWGGGADIGPEAVLLLVIAGASNIIGLLLGYTALQRGKVAVIAPITSTEGAAGAVISILFGEQVAAFAAVALTLIAVGVVLASTSSTEESLAAEPGGLPVDHPVAAGHTLSAGPALPLALGSVLMFGINLYVTGRIGQTLPVVWSILPARLGGAIFIALPLFLSGRLRLTRRAAPFVVVIALAEIVGLIAYAFGARDGIAVASVMASQFGAIAAVVSVVAFGERLRRWQVIGIVMIAVGVAALAAIRGG
jgi:drug/metabolite transporter (DMT)-like permease